MEIQSAASLRMSRRTGGGSLEKTLTLPRWEAPYRIVTTNPSVWEPLMDYNILLLVLVAILIACCVGPMLMMRRRRGDQTKSSTSTRSVTPPDADQR